MTDEKPHRQPLRLALLILLALAGLLVIAHLLMPALHWDGARWVRIEVQVVDAAGGNPISGAAVETRMAKSVHDTGSTDAGGNVSQRVLAPVGGTTKLLYSHNGIGLKGAIVSVSAPGYTEQVVHLSDIQKYDLPAWFSDLINRRPTTIVIRVPLQKQSRE